MAVDISKLTQQQLDDLIQRAESRKHELAREKLAKMRDQILVLAQTEGFTLEEVFSGKVGRKSRRPATPKYRNPADHSQKWSGRGKRPHWFSAALKAGKKEQELLI